MKTTPEIKARAEALAAKMTTQEKLNIIVETSEAIERLGVPKYYHGNEALHGVVRPGRFTVFPQAIALGAMFDDVLLERVADAISTESRAAYFDGPVDATDLMDRGGRYTGLLAFWSPDLNIARDPRWGRTAETYGEDPFLAGKNGAAFVRGLQGSDPKFLKAIATPKHFAANNEEHNRFSCNAVMSEKTLREYHLEPFRMAVVEGGCEAVMGAYNAINGVPCHASRRLLTEILREEWGFDGYVVSDCGAVGNIYEDHHFVPTPADAAAAALNAGVDLECDGYQDLQNTYTAFLGACLADGRIKEERLNEAVVRVLSARIKAGQFDDPETIPWHGLKKDVIGCEAHKNLAREAAAKAAVLLKNNGILPLREGMKVAVMGNNASCVQFGDYSGRPVNDPVTPFDGIKAVAGEDAILVPWEWEADTDAFEAVPASALSFEGDPGVLGSYYGNDCFGGLPDKRRDETIDFAWEERLPDPIIRTPNFSVIWRGEITAPADGDYFFSVRHSGSAKCCPPELSIDSQTIAPNDAVQMKAGEKVPFLLRYVKNQSDPRVALLWKTPKRISNELFASETAAAKAADAVVAVVGLGTQYEREGKDQTDLSLPEEQLALLKAVKEANENLIVVLENGSALSIPWEAQNAAAILELWYPGEQGGAALADLLYGKVSPSGRLPLSFPVSTDDLPPFDDYEMTNGRTYMYSKTAPLYPFGFGLSYTSFRYSDLRKVPQGAEATVTNTGECEADEVAQLYIDSAGIPDQPRLRLKSFRRIHLLPGESAKVFFPLSDESFSLFGIDGVRRVFPGTYTVFIGGGQPSETNYGLLFNFGDAESPECNEEV
ncbi:MAG: glycoside hydrolase family 3 C-terminal domain-containing protein [Clostridia bacterium]|nr:glycoside hydrolase family 3 C-terminal domain-containing protein [Clostridia bacterium]